MAIMLARDDIHPGGTFGEVGMWMSSGYTASLAERLEFPVADAESALHKAYARRRLQAKVQQMRDSTKCKWRVVFSCPNVEIEIAPDFLSQKKVLECIIGTKVERLIFNSSGKEEESIMHRV